MSIKKNDDKINAIMRKDIHPKYYPEAKIKCSCGKTFIVGATKPEINVEICSACHPFYTGEHRFVDTLGRVDKFMAKRKAAAAMPITSKKSKKNQVETRQKALTLKEMLTVTKTA